MHVEFKPVSVKERKTLERNTKSCEGNMYFVFYAIAGCGKISCFDSADLAMTVSILLNFMLILFHTCEKLVNFTK